VAIQQFLQGGFIGKLGDTVGQRWKNLRTLRTYVIPHQPNTPSQMNSRALFAIANQLAQAAMNINGHDGLWDTSTMPEYSKRVGQALRHLHAGWTPEQAFPLYPDGYNPGTTITPRWANYVGSGNFTLDFTPWAAASDTEFYIEWAAFPYNNALPIENDADITVLAGQSISSGFGYFTVYPTNALLITGQSTTVGGQPDTSISIPSALVCLSEQTGTKTAIVAHSPQFVAPQQIRFQLDWGTYVLPSQQAVTAQIWYYRNDTQTRAYETVQANLNPGAATFTLSVANVPAVGMDTWLKVVLTNFTLPDNADIVVACFPTPLGAA